MKKLLLLSILTVILFTSIIAAQEIYPKREFRSAWVATVANIDWPSSRNSTSGEQIAELVDMMDKLKAAGINAVMFQVRTECDALYDSPYEPWSYWLTGEQGVAPQPYYDPLKFAIDEAHSRGMELHAWFNPYRAVKNIGDYKSSEKHVSIKHPEWLLKFKDYTMLDPGQPEVKDYIAKIITDVIRRYDVDGIHFDDYFYPYSPKVSNEDSLTFAKFKGSYDNIDDWRRYSINSMVAQVYDSIKAIKPNVKYGISPFGIVENHYAGTNGFNSYQILYCDPLTWIKDKTVDYVNPQLYWERGHKLADYSKLLPWWDSIVGDRHLYIGHFSSRFESKRWEGTKNETIAQIKMNRQYKNVLGSVFFSAKSLTENYNGFADSLTNGVYKYPALLPIISWKDTTAPTAPGELIVEGDYTERTLTWDVPEEEGKKPVYFVIYRFPSKDKIDFENSGFIITITNNARTKFVDKQELEEGKEYVYAVSSLDRLHNESKAVSVVLETE